MLNFERFEILRFLKVSLRLAFVCFLATIAGHAQTYTVLHEFAGEPTDGAFANGELTQDSAGNFYGTTDGGGINGDGTVFKMNASGEVTVLHSFADDQNGMQPQARTPARRTRQPLRNNIRLTVFRLDPSNDALKTLHQFGLGNDGGPRLPGWLLSTETSISSRAAMVLTA